MGRRAKIQKLVGNTDGQPPITQALNMLSPEKVKFAQLVAEGMTLTDALKESHPNLAAGRWVSRYAHKLAKDPRIREQIESLQQAMRVQFVINAPAALDRLETLAESSSNERVKLEANLEILNRAGMQPPQRVETLHIGLWGQLAAEDVRAMIKKNIDGLESIREEK